MGEVVSLKKCPRTFGSWKMKIFDERGSRIWSSGIAAVFVVMGSRWRQKMTPASLIETSISLAILACREDLEV
jgi:hypothetical protein